MVASVQYSNECFPYLQGASKESCTNFVIQYEKRRVAIDSMFGGVLIAFVQYIASLRPPVP